MTSTRLEALIKESIRLELNVAALYGVFADTLEIDREFWWELQQEEKSHAALLRTALDSFVKRGNFPSGLLADSIEELKQSNHTVEQLIETFRTNPPTRCEACRAAVRLEMEAGELHYTRFMEKEASTPIEKVFKTLNRNDQDHVNRIREHCSVVEEQAT